jgi:hypothetical protein
MPRRKKKYMLLRGKFGSFIVVERRWYDYTDIAKQRGEAKVWWIVAESDDHGALQKMAELTDDEVSMMVKHTYEDEKGNLTNVRSETQDETVLPRETVGERARPCGVDTRAEWVQVPNPA